jgi:selenocysteine-specific elongation factor
MVSVAARPGGPESGAEQSIGVDALISTLRDMTVLPSRGKSGPFVFNVDHCFSIKGQV